jgi:hypothetical protein
MQRQIEKRKPERRAGPLQRTGPACGRAKRWAAGRLADRLRSGSALLGYACEQAFGPSKVLANAQYTVELIFSFSEAFSFVDFIQSMNENLISGVVNSCLS